MSTDLDRQAEQRQVGDPAVLGVKPTASIAENAVAEGGISLRDMPFALLSGPSHGALVQLNQPLSPWRLSVAPMMAWTDRHCRAFHRLLTKRTRLYTEMITTGALVHGDVAKHLDFDACEHPVALQIGGSDARDLAQATALAVRWGYAEVNLNCGCPSDRVQRGAFGACLMNTPSLVADGVKAMLDAAQGVPVTVKHRLGIGRDERYDFVRDFVGTVAEAGCQVFIVHARNAWLDGLSPKDNRDVPPLRYDDALRLKRDFPSLTFVLNGGVSADDQIAHHLEMMHGVMVGRAAYHEPWTMRQWDARFLGAAPVPVDRDDIEAAMVDYMTAQTQQGIAWPSMARHMLGLRNGQPGARRWRQVWSDQSLKHRSPTEVSALARQPLQMPKQHSSLTPSVVELQSTA